MIPSLPRSIVSKFYVNWDSFQALMPFMSRDRYVLRGIYVEKRFKHAVLVATDGRHLAAYKTSIDLAFGDQPLNFILPLELIQRIKAPKKLDAEFIVEQDSNEKLYVSIRTADGFTIGMHCVDGNYPKWRQAVPTGALREKIVFQANPSLLTNFEKAMKILCPRSTAIKLWQSGEENSEMSPYLVDIGLRNFTGILMPVRWMLDPLQIQPYATTDEN